MIKDVVKFRALVGAAQADGEFDGSEKEFIQRLADLQDLSEKEVKELLKHEYGTMDLVKKLSYDDKIEILVFMVRLMKIDGKVLLSEIKFGEKVAKNFGFQDKSIGFLTGIVEINPGNDPNIGRIKFRMRNYLREES